MRPASTTSLLKTLRVDEIPTRILWGLENPSWGIEAGSPEAEELEVGRAVISRLLRAYPETFRSSERPMGNHAKLLIVDEDRLLVGSDNILAHGQERGADSSREVALLMEHPLLARRALGSLLLERPDLWFPFNPQNRDRPWEIFELLRRQVEALSATQGLGRSHSPDLLEFAAESTFREFTDDGKIKKDSSGNPVVTNSKLSARWERLLQSSGKGRFRDYMEDPCKQAHEFGFLQIVWNEDKSFNVFPIGSQPPLPPKDNIERDPEGAGTGAHKFVASLGTLEPAPFASVDEGLALKAAQISHPWLKPSRWGMEDDDFLSWLEEHYFIVRLPGGTCRRVRITERADLRKKRATGVLAGPPNAICTKCKRSFHHPHYGARKDGDVRGLSRSICLECRAQAAGASGAKELRESRRPIAISKDYAEAPRRDSSTPSPVSSEAGPFRGHSNHLQNRD